ncbi:hypothetical protein FA13DRAFT_1724342 [Coprinellus micaceus]|uniref:Uncharacterized protein n=1 Tax=Coprinellus micaceus TaxID=71717 RepID=A0A4Y7U1G3_COPMI|nr:hypothetical protein FA13DRAFT_1746522 [Coprinellus micaceus]TEB40114.1 hypothetical protein FA13DRAFT_1724342 [Coprinellus micaceus]
MNYTRKTQKRRETIVESQGGGKTLVKVQRVHPSIFRPCRLDTIGRLRAKPAA